MKFRQSASVRINSGKKVQFKHLLTGVEGNMGYVRQDPVDKNFSSRPLSSAGDHRGNPSNVDRAVHN